MLLFDLQDFDKDQMITYLKTMAAIAAADGNIHDSERAFFNHMMELFNIPEASRMFIRQNLKNPPALGPLLKEITDRKLMNQIVRDAYLMAYIDEEMHPKESETLRTVANIFKLDEAQVELISRWAAKGYEWRKEGYELSILE